MADISKIKVSSVTYDIKDAGAIRSAELGNIIPVTWEDHKYVRVSDGTIQTSNPYAVTGWIEVDPSYSMTVRSRSIDNLAGLCYFTKDKNYISGITFTSNKLIDVDLEIPQGTKYIRYSLYVDDIEKSESWIKYTNILPELMGGEADRIKEQTGIYESEESVSVVKHNGSYIYKTGAISAQSQFFYTDSVEFKRGDVVEVTSAQRANTGDNVLRISKWTKSGAFVKAIDYGTENMTVAEYVVTDPVEYLRFSGMISQPMSIYKKTIKFDESYYGVAQDSFDIGSSSRAYAFNGSKIMCIGDSLTRGSYYASGWTGQYIAQNYPYYLSRFLNTMVENAGVGGYTATDWWNNKKNTYNFADYDTYVIWLGTNGGLTDTLSTDVDPYTNYENFANTNTGNYCKIICKIKNQNPTAVIFLSTIFASSAVVDTVNTVIKKIATKYGLPVIENGSDEVGVTAHPELHAGINNIHFGKGGNIFLANRFAKGISEYFAKDPVLSEYCVSEEGTGPKSIYAELDGKLDKVNEVNRIYGTNSTGAQTRYYVSTASSGWHVAMRQENGELAVRNNDGTVAFKNDEAIPKRYVDSQIQDVREVAEGKCKAYTVNENLYGQQIQLMLSEIAGSKAYHNGVDITQDVINGVYTNWVRNPDFASSSERLSYSIDDYIVEETMEGMEFHFYNIGEDIKKGDIIYVIGTNYPDRWVDTDVSGSNVKYLRPLEGQGNIVIVGSTPYRLKTSTTDAGQAGYITFVLE